MIRWGLAVCVSLLMQACVSTGGGVGGPGGQVSAEQTESSRRAKARFDLASAYFAEGKLEVALEEVNRSLQSDDSLAAPFNLRGLILAALGRESQAQASFERALQISPADADVLQNFAWFECQRANYRAAQGLFEQALKIPYYRDAARTMLAMGVCQARAGALREAEASLSRAQERDPGNPSVLFNLAEVQYRLGEYDRALKQIRRFNAIAEWVTPQTLWLAIRAEHRLGNEPAVVTLGQLLKSRYPQSREALALERRNFDE